jgi:hypothetical protein
MKAILFLTLLLAYPLLTEAVEFKDVSFYKKYPGTKFWFVGDWFEVTAQACPANLEVAHFFAKMAEDHFFMSCKAKIYHEPGVGEDSCDRVFEVKDCNANN